MVFLDFFIRQIHEVNEDNIDIFKKEEIYRIIIGSSNMTSAALTVNLSLIHISLEYRLLIASSNLGHI